MRIERGRSPRVRLAATRRSRPTERSTRPARATCSSRHCSRRVDSSARASASATRSAPPPRRRSPSRHPASPACRDLAAVRGPHDARTRASPAARPSASRAGQRAAEPGLTFGEPQRRRRGLRPHPPGRRAGAPAAWRPRSRRAFRSSLARPRARPRPPPTRRTGPAAEAGGPGRRASAIRSTARRAGSTRRRPTRRPSRTGRGARRSPVGRRGDHHGSSSGRDSRAASRTRSDAGSPYSRPAMASRRPEPRPPARRRGSARASSCRPSLGECPGQAREVARWRLAPALAVRVPAIDVYEETRERAHVLVVVADDVDQWPRLAEAQEVEVARRDLPAGDVAVAAQPEELRLHRREARVGHPVAEHAPDERQQVQVAGMQRRVRAGHPEAGDEQRPVEAAAVVRDQPAAARDPRRQLGEQRRLVGVVGEQQLDLAEAAALPPAESDEERERARGRREPGRLRVKAEQGSVRPAAGPAAWRAARGRPGSSVVGDSTTTYDPSGVRTSSPPTATASRSAPIVRRSSPSRRSPIGRSASPEVRAPLEPTA